MGQAYEYTDYKIELVNPVGKYVAIGRPLGRSDLPLITKIPWEFEVYQDTIGNRIILQLAVSHETKTIYMGNCASYQENVNANHP